MKKKVIGIAAVILALAAGFFIYMIYSASTAASDAVKTYNAAVQEYNEAIAPYNETAAGITEANTALQQALDSAKASLDKAAPAYEPDTLDQLESAVQKTEKVFAEIPVQIDPLEEQQAPGGFNTKEMDLARHEAETALKAVEEAMEKIPAVPKVPDYSKELKELQTAQKKYEDSVQKLANVTAPEDSFVRERLERIDTVAEAQAVTAEHDPNGLLGKEGGYKGCVYFLDERVDRSLLPQEAFAGEKDKAAEGGEGSTEAAAAAAADPSEGTEAGAAEAADTSGSSEAGTAEAANASGDSEAGAAEAANAAKTAAAGEESASGTASTDAGTAAAGDAATEENAAANHTAAEETAATDETAAANHTAAAAGNTVAAGTAAAGETEAAAAPEAAKESIADVVMIGTAGGGAVEVYATEEEAKKRAEYIAFFEGSVMDAGPCLIEGTCVIRASKHLPGEQQQKLLKEVRDALLAVDD